MMQMNEVSLYGPALGRSVATYCNVSSSQLEAKKILYFLFHLLWKTYLFVSMGWSENAQRRTIRGRCRVIINLDSFLICKKTPSSCSMYVPAQMDHPINHIIQFIQSLQ